MTDPKRPEYKETNFLIQGAASATPTPASEGRRGCAGCLHSGGCDLEAACNGDVVDCVYHWRAPAAAAPQPADEPVRGAQHVEIAQALELDVKRQRVRAEKAEAALAGEHSAREAAERWQVEVAEGIGYLNRAEGQSGYEVAEPSVIVEAFKAAEQAADASRAEVAELWRALELYQAAIYRQGNLMQGYRPAVDEEKLREAETAARAALKGIK